MLEIIKTSIKRLFCDHDYRFVRNIHGDAVMPNFYWRTWRCCAKCGHREANFGTE